MGIDTSHSLNGSDMEALTDEELKARIGDVKIFAKLVQSGWFIEGLLSQTLIVP